MLSVRRVALLPEAWQLSVKCVLGSIRAYRHIKRNMNRHVSFKYQLFEVTSFTEGGCLIQTFVLLCKIFMIKYTDTPVACVFTLLFSSNH